MSPCGTKAAYSRHYYHGQRPCNACVEANRQYRRRTYQSRRIDGLNRNSLNAYIVDLLSAEARWIRQSVLIDMVVDKTEAKRASVKRAIYRMRDAGYVRRRHVDGTVELFSDRWAPW